METLIRVLEEKYSWQVRSSFTEKELNGLIQTGEEISETVEKWLPGIDGASWIRKNLGKAIFHLGGLPQKVVSVANGGTRISLVFFNYNVWLDPSTFNTIKPTQWVTHELGHVLDNSFHKGAIWWGGGPSDDMIKSFGGNPKGLRWANTKALAESMPEIATWKHHNNGHQPYYGDNSSADYFAETWMYSIYRPGVIPPMARDWFLDWIRDQALIMID